MFNIFFLAFAAIILAIGLAIFVTRQKKPGLDVRVPPEDGFDPSKTVAMNKVFDAAERMCSENGLVIKERIIVSEHETYWITESTNSVFFGNYVFGFLRVDNGNALATLTHLLEFKDFVKSLGSTKGFYFTNGFFTRDVYQPLEGPRVALYNALAITNGIEHLGVQRGY